MIFWRNWPKKKPEREGYYLCTCNGLGFNEVVILYWQNSLEVKGGRWVDKKRMNMFEGYKIYKSGRATAEYNRVFEDKLCERIDVIGWKELPKTYKGGFFGWLKRVFGK